MKKSKRILSILALLLIFILAIGLIACQPIDDKDPDGNIVDEEPDDKEPGDEDPDDKDPDDKDPDDKDPVSTDMTADELDVALKGLDRFNFSWDKDFSFDLTSSVDEMGFSMKIKATDEGFWIFGLSEQLNAPEYYHYNGEYFEEFSERDGTKVRAKGDFPFLDYAIMDYPALLMGLDFNEILFPNFQSIDDIDRVWGEGTYAYSAKGVKTGEKVEITVTQTMYFGWGMPENYIIQIKLNGDTFEELTLSSEFLPEMLPDNMKEIEASNFIKLSLSVEEQSFTLPTIEEYTQKPDEAIIVRYLSYADESFYEDEMVEYGEVKEFPDAPEVDGYTFEGWYLFGELYEGETYTAGVKDLIFYASYGHVEVTWDYGFGNHTVTVECPVRATVGFVGTPYFQREGYTIAGIYTDANKENAVDLYEYIFTEDVTFYIEWVELSGITLIAEGVSYKIPNMYYENPQEVEYLEYFVFKDGYMHSGWYLVDEYGEEILTDGGDKIYTWDLGSHSSLIDGDVYLKAEFVVAAKVEFDKQGAALDMLVPYIMIPLLDDMPPAKDLILQVLSMQYSLIGMDIQQVISAEGKFVYGFLAADGTPLETITEDTTVIFDIVDSFTVTMYLGDGEIKHTSEKELDIDIQSHIQSDVEDFVYTYINDINPPVGYRVVGLYLDEAFTTELTVWPRETFSIYVKYESVPHFVVDENAPWSENYFDWGGSNVFLLEDIDMVHYDPRYFLMEYVANNLDKADDEIINFYYLHESLETLITRHTDWGLLNNKTIYVRLVEVAIRFAEDTPWLSSDYKHVYHVADYIQIHASLYEFLNNNIVSHLVNYGEGKAVKFYMDAGWTTEITEDPEWPEETIVVYVDVFEPVLKFIPQDVEFKEDKLYVKEALSLVVGSTINELYDLGVYGLYNLFECIDFGEGVMYENVRWFDSGTGINIPENFGDITAREIIISYEII